jgi:hypothetical protein
MDYESMAGSVSLASAMPIAATPRGAQNQMEEFAVKSA